VKDLPARHCEERSDEAIQGRNRKAGLLRSCWSLAMTETGPPLRLPRLHRTHGVAAVLTGLLFLASGCSAPDAPAETGRALLVEESAGIHVETAMTVTRQYLHALAGRDAAEMRTLLAPGPRSDATHAALAESGRGIASLSIALTTDRDREGESVSGPLPLAPWSGAILVR
jgi:hypothetical protein